MSDDKNNGLLIFCQMSNQLITKHFSTNWYSCHWREEHKAALMWISVYRRNMAQLWKRVFTFASANFCWRKTETLLGTRDHNLADKWIPAICRNPPLSAETQPSQTEVILMDSEKEGNPNPHVPLTQVSQVQHSRCMVRALLHQQELRDGRMKRNGKKETRKNSHMRSQEQHNHAVSFSISKFNFMLYIKGVRVRVPHPPFGSNQCFSTCGWMSQLSLWGLMSKSMFL